MLYDIAPVMKLAAKAEADDTGCITVLPTASHNCTTGSNLEWVLLGTMFSVQAVSTKAFGTTGTNPPACTPGRRCFTAEVQLEMYMYPAFAGHEHLACKSMIT